VLGASALVLLALAGKRLASTDSAGTPRHAALVTASSGAATGPVERLVVHVAGSVRRAGVYKLPEGARVAEAIARAGGASRRADLGALNLAAPLVDGQQVLVPRRVAPGGAAAAGAGEAGTGATAAGAKVSLSTATIEQLDELPGVGPVTAQQIVDWRAANGPFRSVDDLDDVPGIGPARIEQLREVVTP